MRRSTRHAGYVNRISLDDFSDLLGPGVSARQYAKTISKQLQKLGVSKSAVSRRVIEESQKALDSFNDRRWDKSVFSALLSGFCAVAGGARNTNSFFSMQNRRHTKPKRTTVFSIAFNTNSSLMQLKQFLAYGKA